MQRTARPTKYPRKLNRPFSAALFRCNEALGRRPNKEQWPVDLAQIIPPLVRAKVDFILIGRMAPILHGGPRAARLHHTHTHTHTHIDSQHGDGLPSGRFRNEAILFTTAFVAFSKSIPHALSTARVGIQIKRNIQIGTSRMRSPSQMTYGW